MKGYRVAEARARFGELLDEAEGGEVIFIERHGVRFSLRAEAPAPKRTRHVSTVKWAHPAVWAGQWTWEWGPRGLEFKDTRSGKSATPAKPRTRRKPGR